MPSYQRIFLSFLALASALYLASLFAGHPLPAARPQPPAARTGGITLAFWNLDWFPGQKPHSTASAQQAHVAAVVPIVERLNPDVLGLEEIGDEAAAHLVADHLQGFRVDACSRFQDPATGELIRQQVVLCSRLPLLQAWCEAWKRGADGVLPPRGFAFAAYQPTPSRVLLVYGLHLKSNRADALSDALPANIAKREEAMRQLLAHEQSMAAAYRTLGAVTVVIGGDMNTSLDDDARFAQETTLRALLGHGFQWAWQGIPLANRITLPAEGRYPSTCFDHIFFHGDGARLLGARLELTGRDASDHRPVLAALELR